jgi:hypothetical protein
MNQSKAALFMFEGWSRSISPSDLSGTGFLVDAPVGVGYVHVVVNLPGLIGYLPRSMWLLRKVNMRRLR